MEVVDRIKYKHRERDCPYILSSVMKMKYKNFPKLGCNMPNDIFMDKVHKGLQKHDMTTECIYSSNKELRNYIDKKVLKQLLNYLVKNQKDGFFCLDHNNPKDVTHLVGFLYNDEYKTLDFFDSYNDTRTFHRLRMDKNKITKFINDMFHKYFKDEFIIQQLYEFNQI